jgi:hypothetical protein
MLRSGNGQGRIYMRVNEQRYGAEMRRLDVAEREEALRSAVWKRWRSLVIWVLSALGLGGFGSKLVTILLQALG